MNSAQPQILTPPQRDRLLEDLQTAIAAVRAIPTATPCASCEYHGNGHCDKWLADIPPEHLASGCDEWLEEIPF